MTAHHIDWAIEALARRQHGAFNRTQARDLGASTSLIDRRLAAGAWLRLAPSVYGASQRRTLAVVRRSMSFAATTVDHVPIGTVTQTICDLGARLPRARLEQVVARMMERFDQLPPGTRHRLTPLRNILELRSDVAYVPPTSKLEGALYRVLEHPLLPEYERQPTFPWRPNAPQRTDALIADWRLFPEADGRTWHTRVADFERDRLRDRDALAHGYDVARYGYDELVGDPRAIVDDLLRIGEARQIGRGA
jgi:very-short-patch-repair endonuclease